MSQRERLLAIGTGALVVMLAVFFGWSQITTMFDSRQTALRNVQQQVSQQKELLQKEMRQKQQLEEVIQGTIAAEDAQSVNNYKSWLLGLVMDSGFENPNVNPRTENRSKLFQQAIFTVKGRADLEQVSSFLVKFYQSTEHHQIRGLKLTPITNSRLVDVDFTIILLMGNGGTRVTVSDQQVAQADHKKLQEMASAIVNRNFFSDQNVAPKWSDVATQTFPRGEPIEVALTATDANAGDKLTYKLVEGPEGASVDPSTGTLRWRASENGDYDVRVSVTDNGLPRQSSEMTFKLAVGDPRPRQANFDHAAQAFLVATILNDPESEMWVHLRTTGKMLKLRQGDTLKVGSVEAEITHIGPRDVHLKAERGRLRLPLGEALTAAQIIDTPVAATAAESAAAKPTDGRDEG
jgi:hypothetical protein